MTDRYVGIGGNDGNDGLSWANRKLTLNGAEDTPVVAGDTVYVGPGAYREMLTVDVSGTSGAVITYIGDVTGENTDSVGGLVRVTGSDNDTSAARANCITAASKAYRTFRGFQFDSGSSHSISVDESDNFIIEDCSLQAPIAANAFHIFFDGSSQASHTVRRCCFIGAGVSSAAMIKFNHSAAVDDAAHLVENCVFIGTGETNHRILWSDRVGGITVKNCYIQGGRYGFQVGQALTGGQTITINNTIFNSVSIGVSGTVTGEILEDYNNFFSVGTDRTNTDAGGNSVDVPTLLTPPIHFDGIIVPWWFGQLSEWSSLNRKAGTSEPTDDFFGIVRPTISAKKSWGAIQLREAERETGTVQTGSAALTLADAGDHQIFVPVTATSTTFKVAARYESEYAGTLPRLIVRQPGQADQVDTMVAAADTWEDLSLTFAPAADPPYVVVIFRSLNTSVTGEFDTYWDDLDVS